MYSFLNIHALVYIHFVYFNSLEYKSTGYLNGLTLLQLLNAASSFSLRFASTCTQLRCPCVYNLIYVPFLAVRFRAFEHLKKMFAKCKKETYL